MGAHYWSLAVAGDDHEAVGETVAAWLARKGLDEVPADELAFEIDRDIERGFFLAWDERWTIVLYSDYAEMERLELELAGLDRPVLGFWLHDSDIWGYELVSEGTVVSAFHSNPRYFGHEEPPRGPDDPAALAAVTGVDVATIRTLRSRRGIFKERVCEAFVSRMGLGPAASQYAYRFEGERPPGSEGFQWVHRRFRLRGRARLEGFDLHAIRAATAVPSPPRAPGPDWAALSQAIPPGQLLAMRVMALFVRVVFFLLSPVTWLTGAAFRLSSWFGHGSTVDSRSTASAGPSRADAFLIDPTGRFRIRLDEGLVLGVPPFLRHGLAFRAGRLEVHGNGVLGPVARRALTQRVGEVLYEKDYAIGSLPAKAAGWREATQKPSTEIHCIFVQTPWLVYQFTGRSDRPPTVEDLAVMRRVIDTFEVVPAGNG
jgi:hypothetical protein